MADALQALLVTPRHKVSDREVNSVIAPTVEGQVTILPGHTLFLSDLGPGVVWLKSEVASEAYFVTSGFLEVNHDRVVVLAQGAQRLEDIDTSRAQVDHAELTARLRAMLPSDPGWGEMNNRVAESRARVAASLERA